MACCFVLSAAGGVSFTVHSFHIRKRKSEAVIALKQKHLVDRGGRLILAVRENPYGAEHSTSSHFTSPSFLLQTTFKSIK